MLTFKPEIGPSPGTNFAPEVRLLEAPFGDGYTQPTPNGINHIKDQLALKWDGLTYDQMQDMWTFFMRHQGNQMFYYRPFGYDSVGKWTCKEFTRATDDGIWKMTAKLIQSFTA